VAKTRNLGLKQPTRLLSSSSRQFEICPTS